MADSPVKEGDILAGKYRVERVLGEGGMGVVVSAWHTELDQRVAMKFLLPELAERGDAAERFRREARAAVKIKSEHVARVVDVGTLEVGVPYMVMEFLEGHDLSEELSRRGTLDVEEAVEFVLQACEAIAEAHSVGIVHRDLKPANLFITQRADGSRIIKVLDFGISKTLGGGMDMSLTRTAAIIGSPLYMSPEQMDSAKDVDQRTDIWSLGVILYELLAGKPPFSGNSIPQLCAALLNDTPTPLTHFRGDISEELNQAVLHCLEKSIDTRYSTVAELVSALGGFGPPGSIVSVERVQRVLGHSVVRSSPGGSAPVMTGARTVASGPSQSSGLLSSPNLEVIAVPVPPRPSSQGVDAASQGGNTIANWGRTGAGSEAPKRGPWMWIGGAGAALVVGVAALWAVGTSTSSAAPEPAAQAPVEAMAAAPVEPAEAQPAEAQPAAPQPAQAAEAQPEAEGAAGEPAPSASAEVAAAAKPQTTAAKPAPKPVAKPAAKPTAKPASQKPPQKPAGITDFGGRN
ncbi:MAG: serine/threonine protein kinase [Polyangiaceae bacterium]|nr:serine/threonine protein kinase [Polyangiaceae bacterium]MCB9605248.1 serine/threonine protein kinase [Polyangiaceae bacterium]